MTRPRALMASSPRYSRVASRPKSLASWLFVADEACTVASLTRLDARFPLAELVQRNQNQVASLVNMTLGVVSWDEHKVERLDVMRMLLEAGVDPNWTDVTHRHWYSEARAQGAPLGGDGPLHLAADRGDVEMVKLLLSYKAKNTLADGRGKSPSERARMAGHQEVADILEAWVQAEEEPEVWEI